MTSEIMTAPVLSIIIVNYNGGRLLEACLASLAAHPATCATEIILVDNASVDGSRQWVAAERPDVRLVALDSNLGLTRGFNRGVAIATGSILLSLDSDTEVTDGALDAMLACLDAEPGAGASGATLIYPDGTAQKTARRFPSPLAGLFGRRSALTRLFPNNPFSRRYLMADFADLAVPFDVDTLSTACMAVRRRVIEEVGAYDEAFFVYWSDTDWCHRIKAAGWRILSLPGAVVVHNENLKARHRAVRRTRMVVDFHRGAYRYYAKHHAGPLNPMRYVALAALSARAMLILGQDEWQRLAAGRLNAAGGVSRQEGR